MPREERLTSVEFHHDQRVPPGGDLRRRVHAAEVDELAFEAGFIRIRKGGIRRDYPAVRANYLEFAPPPPASEEPETGDLEGPLPRRKAAAK